MKTPEQIRREVIDAAYGIGTEWEEPNEHGEEGFTRAQAESDIDADDIGALIERAIEIDRAQHAEPEEPEPIAAKWLSDKNVVSAAHSVRVSWEARDEDGTILTGDHSLITATQAAAMLQAIGEADATASAKTLLDGVEVDVSTVEHPVEQYPAGSLLTLEGATRLLEAWAAKHPGHRSWSMPRDVPQQMPLPLFATWVPGPDGTTKPGYAIIEPVLTDSMGPYYALKSFGEIEGLTPPALPEV